MKRPSAPKNRYLRHPREDGRITLITGGAGFIGSYLAESLLDAGQEVHVLDDLSTGCTANILHLFSKPRFHFIRGSVLDLELLRSLTARVDFVYHLAAAVGVSLILSSSVESMQANVIGTENVLRAASERGIGVLISSTSEVYGQSDCRQQKEDQDLILRPPTSPRWGYACAKLLDEFMALAYWRERNIPVFVARLFNVVGPRQSSNYGMVLPRFVKQALAANPLTIYGDGNQSRCFCHVKDIVRGLRALPTHTEANGEIVNLGHTDPISILDLARRVKLLTRSKSKLEFISPKKVHSGKFEDIDHRLPDISKASRLLGWAPRISLDSTIRSVIAAERKQLAEKQLC